MSVFAFQAGTTIKVNDKTYSLLRQVEPGVWQAEELRTKRIHEFRDDELRASYKSGQLSCVTGLPRVRSATEPTTADYSSEQWRCAKMRIPAMADSGSGDGGHRRSVATQAG